MIVEEVEKLRTCATGREQLSLAFFYCKHGNQNKDNFLAVMRGLISQLIQQSPEILPLLYHHITMCGEVALTSEQDAGKLMKQTLDGSSASTTYIIIDGLDECGTQEIISIVTTLTTIAESLNVVTPATCRLFFTSRNERVISRALAKATGLQIRPKDNEGDIKEYTAVWSTRIQAKFALTEIKRQELESNILSRAGGMDTIYWTFHITYTSFCNWFLQGLGLSANLNSFHHRNVSLLRSGPPKPSWVNYERGVEPRTGA